jgi:hypothetical protein
VIQFSILYEENVKMSKNLQVLKSSAVIKRYEKNPVLSYKDVPYKAALIFNAGVTKYQGKYVMVFRNDYGSMTANGGWNSFCYS